MPANFDTEIDRSNTGSYKWEYVQSDEDANEIVRTRMFFGEERALPLWVADMDFQCPQPVIDALVARAQHGIFGYTRLSDEYYAAVVDWMQKRHGWRIQPEWILSTPGIVPALNTLVRAFTTPGQKVLIQPPVYYPISNAIKNNGAQVIENPLVYADGRYQMDFADLEAKASDPQVVMAVLCSPHNPVSRVWSAEELRRFAEICQRHNVLVIADEIHGDLIFSWSKFAPFGMLGEGLGDRAIICTAASKTFNLAGLHQSNIIVADEALRARFQEAINATGVGTVNVFGAAATEAAYRHGEEWLTQVLQYVEANYLTLEKFLAERLPQIKVIRPEGTYLVWLDCRALELDNLELKRLMVQEAKVYLDEGFIFGAGGDGFERINLACPRAILVEALERIEQAIRARG
jgi:cystathionine beta-lyase